MSSQILEPKLYQMNSEEEEVEELGTMDESTATGDEMFLEVSPKEQEVSSELQDNSNFNFSKKKYCMISQEIREKFIERVLSKKTTIKQAALEFGIKFSTSKAILQTYKKEGRIGKKKTRNRKKKDDLEGGLSCDDGTDNQMSTSEIETNLAKRSFPFVSQSNFLSQKIKQIKTDEQSGQPVVQSQQQSNSIQTVLQTIIANQLIKQAQQKQQQQQQQNNEMMKAILLNAMKQKLIQQEQQKQEIFKQIVLANLVKQNQQEQLKNESEPSQSNSVNPEIFKLFIQQQLQNQMNVKTQNSLVENNLCPNQEISLEKSSEKEQNNHNNENIVKLKQKKIHVIQHTCMQENVPSIPSQVSSNLEIQN